MGIKKSNNEIQLNEIISPSLNDVGFAKGLDEAFENINKNFITLSNRDFVKGDTGDSLNTRNVYFFNEDGSLNEFGEKLKSCIESISTEADRSSIYDKYGNEISLWDAFNSNPGYIQMLFGLNTSVKNDVEEPVSSLYYVFLDGRFANNKLDHIDHKQYLKIKDLSCILVYDSFENGFKALINAFPTMYFEENTGFCWKLNGAETGLPVQGIQGKPGLNSPLHIVQCNNLKLNNSILSGKIDAIFDPFDGYVFIDNTNIDEYINLVDGSCLIFGRNFSSDDNGIKMYFGTIGIKNNELCVFCNPNTAINDEISAESVNNIMKNIAIKNDNNIIHSSIKGLFVPMSNENANKEQAVHLISSTAISDKVSKNTNNRNDLIITSINDINSLSIDSGNLKIDRYLYVRVNKNSNVFNNDVASNSIYESVNTEHGISKYNYVLKYKLVDYIKQLTLTSEDIINPNFGIYDTTNSSNIGSRYFSKDTSFDDNNVSYYNSEISDKLTNYHWYSMPSKFKDCLESVDNPSNENKSGIYRWELCSIKHDWDVTDMLENESNIEYNYVCAVAKYPKDLANTFNTIFTTTISPNSNSDFMWFNGFCLDTRFNDGYDEDAQKHIIPGWNYELFDNALEFVKFIAVYDNDFSSNVDTSLNVNYNINITGDTSKPNKNLFVNGSIQCNSLNCKELDDYINSLDNKVSILESKFDIEELKKIINTLESKIPELESQIDELKTSNDSKEQSINKLMQRVDELESEIDELKKPEIVTLATPEVTVMVADGEVTVEWGAIENAASYDVTFDGQTTNVTENTYTFAAPAATNVDVEYTVTVVAKPVEGANFTPSTAAEAKFTIAAEVDESEPES